MITVDQFENFNDVKHTPLQAYNRTVMFHNILSDFGMAIATKYWEQFNETGQKQMYLMNSYIKYKGVEAAKKAALKNFEPELDDSQV